MMMMMTDQDRVIFEKPSQALRYAHKNFKQTSWVYMDEIWGFSADAAIAHLMYGWNEKDSSSPYADDFKFSREMKKINAKFKETYGGCIGLFNARLYSFEQIAEMFERIGY